MISLLTVTLVAAIGILIYIFLIWNFNYWRKRGVNGPKPIPLLGSFPSLLTRRQHFADDINDIYTQYKNNESFIGVFLMRTPILMILDPALVHDVFVTSFKHFHDNDLPKLIDKKKDPLLSCNPFVLNGQEWKEQRSLISPGLASGRIKVSYKVIQQVCNSLCDYIAKESKLAPKDGINGKELALRFTSENVADCVLGIKAKSFTDERIPISENVKKFIENNTIFILYSILAGVFPILTQFYKAKFFPKSCEAFFFNLMNEAFQMRRANMGGRLDFMNHVLSLKEKRNLNDIELASHTMTFIIDGLDTSATVISHCLLLLARNPEIQEKLRQEICNNLDKDGELSYEKLNELPYIDACLHESIRIFSPGLWTTKLCTEPYEFTSKNGQTVKLNIGDAVIIPIYALHKDPQYYSEPEQFKPERFLPENGGVRKYRDMGVFLGFGDGPRMCLGMRFALVQAKAAISTIVRNFIIKVNPKTTEDNKLDVNVFTALKEGGVWLNFEKRNL